VIRPALLATAGLFLCACASTFQAPPGREQEFARDEYECQRDARGVHPYGTSAAHDLSRAGLYDKCMKSKGYTAK
jgi:hypothetical protein